MPDEYWRTLVAAAGSAGVSALVVSPLDTLRVRWQVTSPSGPSTSAVGPLQFGRNIIRTEGIVHGLVLPGLVSNVLAIACCSGIRFTLYPAVRSAVSQAIGGADAEKGAVAMTLAGFTTGAIGYGVSAPLWMTKTLGQASPELGVASPTMSELWAEGGIARFYRGATPLILRGACLSAGNMVGYDGTKTMAKAYGVTDGPLLHGVASVISAATATALAAPADITMAYVHTTRQRGHPFRGVLQCFGALIRERGLRSLFRGYPIFFLRMAPAFAVNLTIYEQARRLLGLGYLE